MCKNTPLACSLYLHHPFVTLLLKKDDLQKRSVCSCLSTATQTSANIRQHLPARMKKKLILDVDTGVDDAQAILVALADPNVEILGITCCHGNTPLDNVLKNTLRVLQAANRLDIPVHAGCDKPLLAPAAQEEWSESLDKMINQNPGEVTLVATAPLTNLAVAVQLNPKISKKLKALYIMGGNTESRGNTTTCGEFNFVADPEAAYIVLERYTCPTYIATWEFTCRNSLPWSWCDKLLAQNTPKANFVKAISLLSNKKAQSADYQNEITEGKGFNSCDTYALAAAINDKLITESQEVAVTVELEGTYTRGMMVLDYMDLLKKKHKAVIMKTVDKEKLKQMFMNSVK
ncbi:hypothetical protein PBY51_016703 [Eleginops maclovinus]|uniref:Inosine/uridine-preferring nucleoside hydrolase domain-containing protein n=1 Tax=Eleginops maclovinus TaxID=56733 RepID=A0AAN7ZTV6_ELEMC|nr:hypothetical protein PBY51_016703 [Eleginops maclovinus]